MKKLIFILVIIIAVVLTSCSSTKPVYNSNKQSMQEYHKELQAYYKKCNN